MRSASLPSSSSLGCRQIWLFANREILTVRLNCSFELLLFFFGFSVINTGHASHAPRNLPALWTRVAKLCRWNFIPVLSSLLRGDVVFPMPPMPPLIPAMAERILYQMTERVLCQIPVM